MLIALRYCSFIVIITLLLSIDAAAQLVIDKRVVSTTDPTITLDDSRYPIMQAVVRARNGNSIVPLAEGRIHIIEDSNRYSRPRIVQSESDGFVRIQWVSKSRGAKTSFMRGETYAYILVANDQGLTGYDSLLYRRTDVTQVRFWDFDGNVVSEVSFGAVQPGTEYEDVLQIVSTSARIENGVAVPLKLDSLVFSNPEFRLEWVGSSVGGAAPPNTTLLPGFNYYFRVKFRPSRSDYYRETLTAYYEGGQTEQLVLLANRFPLPENKTLFLLEPNGGGNYAPCQQVLVRWTGSVPNVPTIIEFSENGGTAYTEIGRTNDTTFLWTIPSTVTFNGRIRVRQELRGIDEYVAPGDSAFVARVAWRADGQRYAAIADNGFIREWSTATRQVTGEARLGLSGFPVFAFKGTSLEYVSENTIVSTYTSTQDGRDYLHAVEMPGGNTRHRTALAIPFGVREFKVSPDASRLFLVPKAGTGIQVHSAQTGDREQSILFNAPVTTLAFDSRQGYVLLMDGSVFTLNPVTLAIAPFADFGSVPMVGKFALSPDGTTLTVQTRVSTSTLTSAVESSTLVYHLPSSTFIRRYNAASNPAGVTYSSSGRYVGIGYLGIPQLSVWNLPQDAFLGSIGAHQGALNDLKFSPDGLTILSSADARDNVRVRRISFPESDDSDNTFRIVRPGPIEITGMVSTDQFVATSKDTVLQIPICNRGVSPIIPDNALFLVGRNFALPTAIGQSDTIRPGECLNIAVRIVPVDTGAVLDSLLILSCGQRFSIALQVRSLPRNLLSQSAEQLLGETCAGDSAVFTVDLIRNNDPVPVTINRIEVGGGSGPFTPLDAIVDSVLQPGQVLRIRVLFKPLTSGPITSPLIVFHSGLPTIVHRIDLNARGLGANVTVPPLLTVGSAGTTRLISVRNNSPNTVRLEGLQIEPANTVSFAGNIPLDIGPNQSVDLPFDVLASMPDTGTVVRLQFSPCIVTTTTRLRDLAAQSTVTIDPVQADPRGEAGITVRFNLTSNAPTVEEQTFEANIEMNPRLFLPRSVESSKWQAELVRNQIVGDRRQIGLRIRGRFRGADTLCVVRGLAGLGETDTTLMTMSQGAPFFGVGTQVTVVPGLFQLINLCDDRRLIVPTTALAITSVGPNPSRDFVNLSIESDAHQSARLGLYSPTGQPLAVQNLSLALGQTDVRLNLSGLASGSYVVQVTDSKGNSISRSIVVRP